MNDLYLQLAARAAELAGATPAHARYIALNVVADHHEEWAKNYEQDALYTEGSKRRVQLQQAASKSRTQASQLRQQAKAIRGETP